MPCAMSWAWDEINTKNHAIFVFLQAQLTNSFADMAVTYQDITMARLQKDFGPKTGRTLHSFCRGVDGRDLDLAQERKSIGAEVNYGIRFKTGDDCAQFLDQLSAEVASRMERAGLRGRCITLKLMVRAEDAPRETSKFLGHGICDAASKSGNLSSATRDAAVIGREVRMLRAQMGKAFEDLRGVGIQGGKWQFNINLFGLSFDLKKHLSFGLRFYISSKMVGM